MTISSLNKRLLIYAAITSPILAIYAIAPLYIFDKLNLSYSAILFSGLTIGILITWLINMFVRWKLKNLKEWQQFVVGFLLSSLSHIPKIWIKPVMPFENVIERYFTYPIITTFAIQVIIWVIINSVISNFKKKEMAEEVETGRYWYKHKLIRRSFLTIKRALPNMFWYLDNEKIPKTTNGIESYFGHLKNHLDLHRGLTKEHRINFIKWYIYFRNKSKL